MRVAHEALQDLRAKYAEMLSMRLADVAQDPVHSAPDRVRHRMRQLAARFPGALREIDELALVEIRRRIMALDSVLALHDEAELWMEAIVVFHSLTRGALVAKRWLGKRKRIDEAVRRGFQQALGELPFPEDSRAWAAHLSTVASPPRGRLLDAVFARIGRELQLPDGDVRGLVFPRLSR